MQVFELVQTLMEIILEQKFLEELLQRRINDIIKTSGL